MHDVKLWGALRPAVGGASSVVVEANTINELFRKLAERYPAMARQIEKGIAVSIDGVIYRDSWSKQLPSNAEIYLLPRIEGG